MMDRRCFLMTSLAGAFAIPFSVEAQEPQRVYRIGAMAVAPTPNLVAAWQRAIRERGWIEGKNLIVEYRYSMGKDDLFPGFAEELTRLKLDLIVAVSDVAVEAARRATSTTPIVMVAGTDPVAAGFVASLARPGGRITGIPMFADELAGKQLDLLKEM